MNRREFIAGLTGTAVWPRAALTQEPGRVYRIAFLTAAPSAAPQFRAMFEEWRVAGFIPGQNLFVTPGGLGFGKEQLAALADDISKLSPDVIVSIGPTATRAAQTVTSTIPILATSDDMVADGLVHSFAY